MKRIAYLIVFALILSLTGCENQEREWPNFDYNTIYFPEQYPLRTIILGHDRVDNTSDKNHIFHVGVSIGGLAKNDRSWEIGYVVDNALADSLVVNGDTIMALPSSYYEILSSPTIVTIPSGSMEGLIEVKLTDAFFADSASLTRKYALGIRITDKGDADSVLSGKVKNAELGADLRKDTDWDVQPKNFTVFMVNYINEYHGNYFVRGAEKWVNEAGHDTSVVYRERFLHDNIIRSVKGIYSNASYYEGLGISSGGKNRFVFTVSGSNINITPAADGYTVNGNGTFYDETTPQAETLAGMKYPTMYFQYNFADTLASSFVRNVTVNDTLVRISRGLDANGRFADRSAVIPYNVKKVE